MLPYFAGVYFLKLWHELLLTQRHAENHSNLTFKADKYHVYQKRALYSSYLKGNFSLCSKGDHWPTLLQTDSTEHHLTKCCVQLPDPSSKAGIDSSIPYTEFYSSWVPAVQPFWLLCTWRCLQCWSWWECCPRHALQA